MARFHIKDNGEPGRCLARPGNCPKGTNDEHYSSKDEARRAFELSAGNAFEKSVKLRGSSRSSIPVLEPYSFSGEAIEKEIEARGTNGFKDPSSGAPLSVKDVARLVSNKTVVDAAGNEYSMESAVLDTKASRNDPRNALNTSTRFFYAGPVDLEGIIRDGDEIREARRAAALAADAPGAKYISYEKKHAMLANMGTSPQYAIDEMLGQDSVGEGFYVYELKSSGKGSLNTYNLGVSDKAIDPFDPAGESERLGRETGDKSAAFKFYSRYSDPGSAGYLADPGTMEVLSKRWVSAEEAKKSPSVYNVKV